MAEPDPPHAPPGFALGLRTQIMLALVTGLGLLVVLVAITADSFATRALERERRRVADLAAATLAERVARSDAPALVLSGAEDLLLGHDGIIGFEVGPARRGLVGEGLAEERSLPDGGRVRVWVQAADDDASSTLVRIVVLYAALSALGILVLSYALLTRLIVRPIADLTRAADRLARGVEGARAEPGGAAELGQLAVTFNHMAADLTRERSALKARLAELERAHEALAKKDASLVRSEKLASVGRLAAGVAHEIGNPLTSILGLVDLLEQGDLDGATQREFLRRIHAETDRIHRTIRDLLDFSRQGPEDDGGGADVRAAVERALDLAVPQRTMRDVRVERRLPDAGPRVRMSEEHLVQVLLNLLMNAADAMSGTGGITIEATSAEGRVRLSVTDTGPGIAPEVEGRLFEPFVTTKPTGKGTGLGLAVCHSLIERAGGTIRTERPEAGGACFVLSLPAA